MAKNKNETEQTEPVTEQPELTLKERITRELETRKAADTKAAEAAQKRADETAALASVEDLIDSDVESTIENIKKIDADVTAEKAKMAEELKPLNDQMTAIKAKYSFDEQNKTRKELEDALVAKVGEVAAKVLIGGSKSTGTGSGGRSGKLDGMSVRETVAKMYLDEGLHDFEVLASTMKERFPDAKVYGNNEKINGGTQKNGNLMKRHMDEMVTKAGTVIKNSDGTYSWK